MRCTEVRALLSAHMDADLTHGQAHRLEEHLCGCQLCEREWQNLQGTARLVARLAPERCPVDLRCAVVQAASRQRPQPAWTFRIPRVASAVAASLGAVLLAASGSYFLSHGPGKTSLVLEPAPETRTAVMERSLHDQYRLAGGLGVDGLMLSMTDGEPGSRGTVVPVGEQATPAADEARSVR